MNVVLTVNAAWNIWNFRLPLVRALLEDGHKVTVLAPRDETVPNLEALGCDFVHLDMSAKGLNPFQDALLIQRFRTQFRSLRPDLVLSFTIKNNLFGAYAAKSLGLAFVPNVTGLGTAFLTVKLLERIAVLLYKTAFRTLPVVFFQNNDDRALFVESGMVTPDQARSLPGSGIDLQKFASSDYPLDLRSPVFLMIARLLRDKGVLEFVDAARRVKSRHAQARFQLLGATGAENRTAIDRQTVRSWEEEGVIEYLGTTEDVRPTIEASQCVVLPSYREGAPRTLIEAAAMARPLIATDVPGCRAVVDHGKTGFLCDAKSADSLAAACESFLSLSLPQRVAMGRSGRAKMEREYCQSIVVNAYRDVLSRLAHPSAPVVE